MEEERLKGRLVALFLAGCLAFGYPLLGAFNAPATVLGLPLLYVYVFGTWAVLIALVAVLFARGS